MRSLGLGSLYRRVGIILARDIQALHFGLQGGTFQSQTLGGPFRTRQNSSGFSEDARALLIET